MDEFKGDTRSVTERLNTVTRLEVIDENGRSYQNFGVNSLEIDFQDDDTTLKIFIRSNEGATYKTWEDSQNS